VKIVAKPIEMIAFFHEFKRPEPYKFRYTEENGDRRVVIVEKVLTVECSHIAGMESLLYTCRTSINDIIWTYQLKYIIKEYRWELYRM